MKKISEQTKNFLFYGIENTIQPKEIYKLDGVMLFFVFLFFFLAEATSSPAVSKIFLVTVYVGFVLLSFSRTEVTGKKVFWIYGIQSLTFSILFCWAGTIFMLTTMKKEIHTVYLAVLAVIYIFAIAAYMVLTITLIKKDVYNPSATKKLTGGWCLTGFVMLGIGAAKVLSAQAGYTTVIRIAGLGFYFVSLLCILGVVHLVKYFAVKKLEVEKYDKI
ncbi:hypothetical protein [Parablautia sp. Marseille-Q6255]|uniref:hypothetical protein n=1 Tax=Parablautia sp. Marseille-Q6255 TaxID=3039593 RepID=UPI0024BC93FF|nr:hypothetical protein [Parablautia sp. Marseille-Q6255]